MPTLSEASSSIPFPYGLLHTSRHESPLTTTCPHTFPFPEGTCHFPAAL